MRAIVARNSSLRAKDSSRIIKRKEFGFVSNFRNLVFFWKISYILEMLEIGVEGEFSLEKG